MVPNRRDGSPKDGKKEHPIIDISYVELPERVTHRISLGSILGAAAFLSLLAVPGTAEEDPVLAVILAAVFAVCANLSMREDCKRK